MLCCALLATLLAGCGGSDSDGSAMASPGATTEASPSTEAPKPSSGTDAPPDRDLLDLARRYRDVGEDVPRQLQLPAPVLGQSQQFDLLELPSNPDDLPSRRTGNATLRAVSEHAYFFVEDGSDVPDSEVDDAARALEEQVWPAVTGAFGLPPTPGVDGDPRIVIVHADLGGGVGGYVSSEDAYPRAAVPTSNQREAVYMNLNIRPLGSGGYVSTLGHELQHVIHARPDPNEDAWINEGLSEYAAGLVSEGRALGGGSFLDRPDTQLNSWDYGQASAAHYAAAGLFAAYLAEQTGGDVQALAAEPEDGVAGVRAYLRAKGVERSFEQLVGDWAVANYIDEPQGAYGYADLQVGPAAETRVDATGARDADVGQFAADYLEFRGDDFAAGATIRFDGALDTPVIAAQADSDGAFWWSNRGDSIDATLTRQLDLTEVDRATLTFRTWFDIERLFDYGYVAVSTDSGDTWTALAGDHTTTEDPLSVGYGPGYTGRSGGGETPRWLDERINLGAYAGSRILLRFEYVTDDSFDKPAWAIDDIAVPETGFEDDAGSDTGGWQRAGFKRVDAPLPQRFELRLITFGDAPRVEPFALDGDNRAEVRLTGLGGDDSRAVLVVVATTEGTTEEARYRYEVTPAGEAPP